MSNQPKLLKLQGSIDLAKLPSEPIRWVVVGNIYGEGKTHPVYITRPHNCHQNETGEYVMDWWTKDVKEAVDHLNRENAILFLEGLLEKGREAKDSLIKMLGTKQVVFCVAPIVVAPATDVFVYVAADD